MLGPDAGMRCGYVRMLAAVQKAEGTAESTSVKSADGPPPLPAYFAQSLHLTRLMGGPYGAKS